MKCPGNNNLYFPNCVTHQIDIVKKKAHIEVEKEKRKEIRLKKDQIINYKAKLQSKVNEIARLIDIGLPCLAKQIHSPQMHGGHVYSVGSNATARFNLHNIHRQGAQSNHFQNDDGLMKEGLRREYGQEYFDFVSGLRNTPQIGFNNLEYKEKYKIASNIANELRRNGERFNLNERIEKRNEINLKLGIYSFEKCLYTTPGE
jgi:hypothetical protein